MPGQIRLIFLGKGGSFPNGEGVLERLWDPRLEVWVCRGSGADPGAQEQALCWDYSLWDDASPALSSSLLVSFSPCVSWRTAISHPGPPRLCPFHPPQGSSSSSSQSLGTEAHPPIPELGCALWQGCPRIPFPCGKTPTQPQEQLGSAGGTGTPCSQCPHLHGSFLDVFEPRPRFF